MNLGLAEWSQEPSVWTYEQSRFSCLELLVSCILLLFLPEPCNNLDTRRHPLKHELF